MNVWSIVVCTCGCTKQELPLSAWTRLRLPMQPSLDWLALQFRHPQHLRFAHQVSRSISSIHSNNGSDLSRPLPCPLQPEGSFQLRDYSTNVGQNQCFHLIFDSTCDTMIVGVLFTSTSFVFALEISDSTCPSLLDKHANGGKKHWSIAQIHADYRPWENVPSERELLACFPVIILLLRFDRSTQSRHFIAQQV